MPEPFTALWGRSRPARDPAAEAQDDWPGPVGADATVEFGGRLLYGCVGSAAPRLLQLFDAAGGARVAPPTALAAGRQALAFAVTAHGLLAAGTEELVAPLESCRSGYPDGGYPAEEGDVAAVAAVGPLLATFHPFHGLAVRDLDGPACLGTVKLVSHEFPALTTTTIEGLPHAVLSLGHELRVFDLTTPRQVACWTNESDVTVMRTAWTTDPATGRVLLLTADFQQRLQRWDPLTGEAVGPSWELSGRAVQLHAAVVTDDTGTQVPVAAVTTMDRVQLLRADTGGLLLSLRPEQRVRSATLGGDGLLLLGTDAGPGALRLDPALLSAGHRREVRLDLAAFPAPAQGPAEGGSAETGADTDSTDTDSAVERAGRLWGADQVMVLAPERWEAGLLDDAVRADLDGLPVPLHPLPTVELDPDLAEFGPELLSRAGVDEESDEPAQAPPAGLEQHRWLGSWGDSDLLLSPAGAVQALGPESGFKAPLPLNSGLAGFVACTAELALARRRRDPDSVDDREERAARLADRLRVLDPAALAEGGSSLWADALSDLEAGL
ncbi:SUKH-4 family immunity protein [Streptacidiphilus carbonis]|uniref:SUKH-4 family immunity protein n=1 Tax=Streptacidiphilus carbonis TaxID=105422 RepID=UPI000A517E61|nr:SUKH-4 family immunity protein [Streptacidiphilus carbonis]